MGLSEVADNLVKTYSSEMMRRLETACAIVIKPKIMFLDEPTIGLDPSARKAVWEELTSFRKEYVATVFVKTHYMDEATSTLKRDSHNQRWGDREAGCYRRAQAFGWRSHLVKRR